MPRNASATRVQPHNGAPIEVQIMGTGFLEIVHARDIGDGGVGIWVPHGFEGCDLEREVKLILTLPGQKSFMVRGKIRHHSEEPMGGNFFGIQFVGLDKVHREAIRFYISARSDEDPGSVTKG